MRRRHLLGLAAALGLAGTLRAQDRAAGWPAADLLLLGEQHDAPEHQHLSARVAAELAAQGRLGALALEMAEQNHDSRALPRDAPEEAVRAALAWHEAGWPWAAYGPIVLAALRAGVPVHGANLPRAAMRAAMGDAALDTAVPAAVRRRLEADVRDGHCGLLPDARLLLRMYLAPASGKDYNLQQLERDAVRDGEDWVITGRKIWVSRMSTADFTVVMARVGGGKGHEGISAFIVERGTPGFNVLREIPMLAGHRTYEIAFEDCRIPAKNLLGKVGEGFAPMQLRLNIRRLQIGAWCLGMCRRALEMMGSHAKQRKTFGALLSDRQAIQWWIADAAIKMHACRLMVLDAAKKLDQGQDIRTEASMIKVYATEMASEIIDHAMQTFGAMGVTKELPLHLMAQRVRVMRVYEGPTEVHMMSIAKKVLKGIR